ncbi:MAG: ribbon-helix-helix domain-containing protein [Candidatus Woesearchaeota archaeon]
METISLKIENSILKEIDQKLNKFRYSTRTEFIRDAIRQKLIELEKEEAIRKLSGYKGKFKSIRMDNEADKLAIEEISSKLD